jgi:NAD-dependent deacetylase sirtuin 2
VKPDITFFGEALPARFSDLWRDDVAQADLLLVMGTSLRVAPFASLPAAVAPLVPRVLINREPVELVASSSRRAFRFGRGDNYRDLLMQGDCDRQVVRLVEAAGWSRQFRAFVPARHRHLIKVAKKKKAKRSSKTTTTRRRRAPAKAKAKQTTTTPAIKSSSPRRGGQLKSAMKTTTPAQPSPSSSRRVTFDMS